MTEKIVAQGKTVDIGTSSFKDPANSAGLYIASFSLYQIYRVNRSKVRQACESLYQHLVEQVNKQSLGDARFRVITYREAPTGFNQVSNKEYDNQERTYILVTRDTLRSTRATILVRFLTYGENLYVGVDTYILGKLNLCAFIRKILLTIIIPFFAIGPLSIIFVSFIPGLSQFLLLVYLCIVALAWGGLIQRVIQVGDIQTALRLEFNKALDLGSFNRDDVVMFIKSTLYTTLTSIRDVFEQEGLPIESLDAFIQTINTSNFITNVDSGGGAITMSNSSIGVSNTTSSTPAPQAESK